MLLNTFFSEDICKVLLCIADLAAVWSDNTGPFKLIMPAQHSEKCSSEAISVSNCTSASATVCLLLHAHVLSAALQVGVVCLTVILWCLAVQSQS